MTDRYLSIRYKGLFDIAWYSAAAVTNLENLDNGSRPNLVIGFEKRNPQQYLYSFLVNFTT